MKKNCYIIILLLFSISQIVHAENSQVGTTSAAFLKMGMGARASGMGGAFVAVCDDTYALYWNPAGLFQSEDNKLTATYTSWFQGIKNGFVGYARPVIMSKSAIGVSITYLSIGGIDGRDISGKSTGKKTVSNLAIPVTYSQKLSSKLAVGINLKLISQDYYMEKGSGFGIDLGMLAFPKENFSLGLNLQNIGPKIKIGDAENKLPFNIKGGIAYKKKNLTTAFDLDKPIDDNVKVHVGVEYLLVNKILAIRAGYENVGNLGGISGLSFGLGFNIKEYGIFSNELSERSFLIDYALVSYGDIGYTHRFSLGVNF